MLFYLTLIFACQLIGESLVTALSLPVPGPVVGMALMFCGLMVRGSIPEGLSQVADGILTNLSLLFIPAGVGVMLHAKLLGAELLPISVSLIASTLLTIGVTAWLMAKLDKSENEPEDQIGQETGT